MADNTTLNAGTGGDVIASDDISGVKFQRVKLTVGADGVNDGDVASGNPLPVSETSNLADNAAFTDGTTKLGMSGYIFDEVAGTALTENDAAAARVDSKRAQVMVVEDATTRGQRQSVASNGGASVSGCTAHDSADAGNPVKMGAKAIAHGANPTAVAAADRTDLYANRHGVLFTIGGHPNIITRSLRIGDADGAQTNATMVGTISAGTKVAVTMLAVTCDQANTSATAVKIGFGATTIPADSTTGADGVLFDHDGIPPGSGAVIGSGAGVIGIGADGEELRLTCEDPVGGAVSITFSYYTIES